jgi:hypothetical protein
MVVLIKKNQGNGMDNRRSKRATVTESLLCSAPRMWKKLQRALPPNPLMRLQSSVVAGTNIERTRERRTGVIVV